MEKAQIHADTILAKLDNKHSIFQLFKFCTAHKLTHLFSVDVLSTATHPRNWNTWDSDLCLDFNTMVSQMIGALTNNCAPPPRTCNSDPIHEHKKRGLGIQQPRSTAIPAYFLAVKQDVQHVTEGVWTSNPTPPHCPTVTYQNHVRRLENKFVIRLQTFPKILHQFQGHVRQQSSPRQRHVFSC